MSGAAAWPGRSAGPVRPAWQWAVHHAPRGAGGPPLVLLHGFLGSPTAWDAVLQALPSHGPVWCPWLPGHGPACVLPATWQQAVDDLAHSLPKQAWLAGYSMGARLALAVALKPAADTRGALLVGGHVGLSTPAERAARVQQDAERAAALRLGPLQDFVHSWEALPLFASQRALPAARQAQQRVARLAHDAKALAWSFEVVGLAQMPDLRPAIAAAQQPLLWLTGGLDTRFDSLAASLRRPPWVRHRSLPGLGHNLLLEAPADVAASLADLMENPP